MRWIAALPLALGCGLPAAANGQAHGAHGAAAPDAARAAAPALALPASARDRTPPTTPGSFAPALAVAGEALLATWLEPASAGGHRVRFARHRAGSWSQPVTVAEGSGLFANWADTPGVVAAADGTLYVWWLAKSASAAYAYDVLLARSIDSGETFLPLGALHEDRSPVEHGFVSAVAEGDGVRFYYLDGRATATGGPTQLRGVRVAGAAVGASELVDESVCDCCPTATVAWSGGSAVAYRDRAPGEIRDVRLSLRPAAGPAREVAVGDDRWEIAGCPVNGPALASDGGRLAVAWFSAPADRARVAIAVARDAGRELGPPTWLDTTGPLGRVAAAALPEGFAVAWLARDQVGGEVAELRLLRVGDRGEPAAPLTVARTSAGRASGVPRLVRRGDELWLAWTEPEGPGLRAASLPWTALPAP